MPPQQKHQRAANSAYIDIFSAAISIQSFESVLLTVAPVNAATLELNHCNIVEGILRSAEDLSRVAVIKEIVSLPLITLCKLFWLYLHSKVSNIFIEFIVTMALFLTL